MRNKTWLVAAAAALLFTAACSTPQPAPAKQPANANAPAAIDRTVLPIAGAGLSARNRARRAEGHAAAALRGEGARGRAERAHRPHRRHGLRHVERVRRAGPHADRRAPGQRGTALQPVPHDGALLADAHRAPQRPQPPHEQHGGDHRDGHGVPGQHGAAPEQRGAAGGDAAAERLQHRLLRQEPRDRGVGGQPVRPDHPLADAVRASTSSTGSSAARRTSGRRSSTTT